MFKNNKIYKFKFEQTKIAFFYTFFKLHKSFVIRINLLIKAENVKLCKNYFYDKDLWSTDRNLNFFKSSQNNDKK